jgi:hypothetical protein
MAWIFIIFITGVRLGPLVLLPQTSLLYQPWTTNEYGALAERLVGQTQSAEEKPDSVSFRALQIPHRLSYDQIRASAVEGRRTGNRLNALSI